jgi:hypothetical protein
LTEELSLRASELQKEGKKVQELFSTPPFCWLSLSG